MPASNRLFPIAGAAFAAGIAGTVLVGALGSRERPAEAAPQAASAAWSDPVKAPAKVASDDAQAPLRFQPEAAESDATQAAAPTPLPPERPSSLAAAAEAEPVDAAPAAPVRRRVVREDRGEIRTVDSAARDRPAERPAREPKQRLAESGGVMQWLMERR